MNVYDILAAGMIALAARRGYKSGLAVEGYRLVRMAVAVAAGTSLYGFVSDALASALNLTSGFSDPAVFVLVSLGAWQALRRIRAGVESRLRAGLSPRFQAVGGAAAAAVKTAVFVGGLTAAVLLSPWMPGHDAVSRASVIGRMVQVFVSGG